MNLDLPATKGDVLFVAVITLFCIWLLLMALKYDTFSKLDTLLKKKDEEE